MENTNVKNKSIKGITMIALVITIIVLLILASVTIAAISGDNGVISNANEAEIKIGLSDLAERISLYEIQSEGATNSGNMNYIDKMEQEGIITKITTKENIKLAVIKDKDKLNFSSKLGDAGKEVPSNYVEKMTALNDVYVIGLKDNEVYYIINRNIWSIQGIVDIEELKEAELMITAIFDGNGGKSGGTITKKAGEALGELPISTRSGYTFNGWYTKKTGGEKITNETIMPGADLSGGNVIYYAQWTKDEPVIATANYTVKHYQQALDGSYPNTPTESQTLTGDVGTSITPATKSYTGFTSPGTKTATIASDGSTTIEYQYTRNSYTLTLNKNANIASVTGGGTYKYGQSVSINATLGSSTGYTHTWSNWTSNNTSLQPNISTQNATISMPAGNITLTANGNKTVNKYTATFNGNGGTNGTSITKNYGEQLGTLPISARADYDFLGWYTAISGGTQITSTTTMPARNIIYYARWKEKVLQPGEISTTTRKNNYTDNNGNTATIPEGFKISTNTDEQTISKGLVVINSKDESEFVWVPVPTVISSTESAATTNKAMAVNLGTDSIPNYRGLLYDFSGLTSTVKSKCTTVDYDYCEPRFLDDSSNGDLSIYNSVGITKTTLQNEYNTMITSVIKYKGFYIGRYETSKNASKAAQSKKGEYPVTGTWYGQYPAQMEYSTNSVQGNMIWGSQWDAMLNWALKGDDKSKITGSTDGNHGSYVAETGKFSNDKVNNVYDLEGNAFEWTLEASGSSGRVSRGDCWNSWSAEPGRSGGNPNFAYGEHGSRMSLYIK